MSFEAAFERFPVGRLDRRGFTLIEILASVAILALLVAFLGQVFSQSSLAWERGTQQALRNSNAKAALELLSRDLEMAVVDPQFGFYKDRHAVASWPLDYDAIHFVTLAGSPADGRLYQFVRYKVEVNTNYLDRGYSSTRLNRAEIDFSEFLENSGDPYVGAWWNELCQHNQTIFEHFDFVPVIDDIVRFDVYLYSGDPANFGENPTRLSGPTAISQANKNNDFSSHDPATIKYLADTHRIPPYMDIYLQVASPEAMRRADELRKAGQDARAQEILDANSNVLFKRVYPRMRSAIL